MAWVVGWVGYWPQGAVLSGEGSWVVRFGLSLVNLG